MLAPRKTLHSTPLMVFCSALEHIPVQKGDVLYDIGCGDGRCVIEAARRYGIRAVGIEIDAERVAIARSQVKAAKVDHLVEIRQANALELDFSQFSDATIVFLFLIERGLKKILPQIQQLNCHVLTYLYKFPKEIHLKENKFFQAKEKQKEIAFPVYFYRFPQEKNENCIENYEVS